MKTFLFLHLFIISLLASQFNTKEEFFIDKSNAMSFQTVYADKNKFKPMHKYNFGIEKNTLWIHLNITNTSKKNITKRLYNKRAGLDFIDVYIVKNGKVIKTYSLGDMKKHNKRDNIFRVSYFDLSLKALENIDIFIKQKSYGSMETKWHIVDINYFHKYFNNQTVVYFIIVGI